VYTPSPTEQEIRAAIETHKNYICEYDKTLEDLDIKDSNLARKFEEDKALCKIVIWALETLIAKPQSKTGVVESCVFCGQIIND